jgi:hypothetical protein
MANPQPGAVARAPGLSIYLGAALVLGWLAADDVGFRDSGELGTAAFGLGVAHPTGFAADLLVLRLFSFLPLGHIAFRQNLAVALEAAAGLGLLAAICDVLARRLSIEDRAARIAGALLAVCALASWRTFFETAVAVEVYSLALLAALLAAYGVARGRRSAGLCCLVIGLAPGLHVTAGLFASVLLLGFSATLGGAAAVRFVRARLPMVAAGALIIAYLPLASVRDPALDWGDPETLGAVLAHLTAARIRSAYQGEMLTTDPAASLGVMVQLWELWPLLPLGLFALALGWGRRALAVLAPLGLLTVDLAYAVWINPMGAGDRQVGHMAGAGIALLGGLGAALLCSLAARRAWLRWAALLAVGGLALCLLLTFPRAELADGYAASELLGSGGALSAVPPRSVVLCSSDDACAGGLFALYVEGVRPDVDSAPAQHLWDHTVLRRLRSIPGLVASGHAQVRPEQRAALARETLRRLVSGPSPRPLLIDSAGPLRKAGLHVALDASVRVPLLTVLPLAQPERLSIDALARLDRMRVARLPGGAARGERAGSAWSQIYGAVGEQALGTSTAVRALRTAVWLTPLRAVAWTNLGVGLAASGDQAGARACAERAIVLEPGRATAWVNLARLVLAKDGVDAARRVLQLAEQAGVRDERLTRLAASLPR